MRSMSALASSIVTPGRSRAMPFSPSGPTKETRAVRSQRQQDVRLLLKEAERPWQHTDDFMRRAIHREASTENTSPAKPALPIAVGENDGPRAAGLVVRRREQAAGLRTHTKHREEFERGDERADFLG